MAKGTDDRHNSEKLGGFKMLKLFESFEKMEEIKNNGGKRRAIARAMDEFLEEVKKEGFESINAPKKASKGFELGRYRNGKVEMLDFEKKEIIITDIKMTEEEAKRYFMLK